MIKYELDIHVTVVLGQFELELDWLLVPALVMRGKYWPDLLYRLGLNFDGAARLFRVPGLS